MLTSGEVEFSNVYEFKLDFIELNLTEENISTFYLNGTTEGLLSENYLVYGTTPIETSAVKIIYTIKQLPAFGNLFFMKKEVKEVERLFLEDNFTQDDINNKRIQYKMLRTAYISLNDTISYEVSAEHCLTKLSGKLNVSYTPRTNLPYAFVSTINTLKVNLKSLEIKTWIINYLSVNLKQIISCKINQ